MIARLLESTTIDAERLNAWGVKEPVLTFRRFDALRAELMDRSVSPGQKDRVLGGLLRVGRGDSQAWLAVVVCLLPGLRAVERRYGRVLGEDAWGELLLALWERVCQYDVRRRPSRIAANLLWDSAAVLIKRSRAECDWAREARLTADIGLQAVAVPEPDLPASVLFDLAVEAGVMCRSDAVLIESTRLAGVALPVAAQLLGLGYQAAKKRRRRAEVAWGAWWAAGPDAA